MQRIPMFHVLTLRIIKRSDLILDSHSTAYIWQAFFYLQYLQISLRDDGNEIVWCANKRTWSAGHNMPDHLHTIHCTSMMEKVPGNPGYNPLRHTTIWHKIWEQWEGGYFLWYGVHTRQHSSISKHMAFPFHCSHILPLWYTCKVDLYVNMLYICIIFICSSLRMEMIYIYVISRRWTTGRRS